MLGLKLIHANGIAMMLAINPSYEHMCAGSTYPEQGQVITSYNICGMQLCFPALDICFLHTTLHISTLYNTVISLIEWKYETIVL